MTCCRPKPQPRCFANTARTCLGCHSLLVDSCHCRLLSTRWTAILRIDMVAVDADRPGLELGRACWACCRPKPQPTCFTNTARTCLGKAAVALHRWTAIAVDCCPPGGQLFWELTWWLETPTDRGWSWGGHAGHADALQTPRARALAKLLLLSTGGQLSLSITVHPVDSHSGN